jgi:hypothetical protein
VNTVQKATAFNPLFQEKIIHNKLQKDCFSLILQVGTTKARRAHMSIEIEEVTNGKPRRIIFVIRNDEDDKPIAFEILKAVVDCAKPLSGPLRVEIVGCVVGLPDTRICEFLKEKKIPLFALTSTAEEGSYAQLCKETKADALVCFHNAGWKESPQDLFDTGTVLCFETLPNGEMLELQVSLATGPKTKHPFYKYVIQDTSSYRGDITHAQWWVLVTQTNLALNGPISRQSILGNPARVEYA